MDAETATEMALEYIKKSGNPFAKTVGAKLEDNNWVIKIDIGIYTTSIKTVIINNSSEKVISYE